MVLESNLLSSRLRNSLYNLFNFKIYTMAILNIGENWGMLTFHSLKNEKLLILACIENESIDIPITKEQAIEIIEHLKKEFNI